MKRALITGITGQDGSYLAELLLNKGYEVHGIFRRTSTSSTSRIDHIMDRISLHYGDMTDGHSLREAVRKSQPDEVYNLASQSHVGASFQVPYQTRESTFFGVDRLITALEAEGIANRVRFYQASTSEMFGNSASPPQNENSPFGPVSPYAKAKLEAHQLVKRHREENGRFFCSGILFNHESARRGIDFVTRKITDGVARIASGKDNLIVLGNLDAKRDWGFAGDYVEAMWLMLQQDKPGEYVVATGETRTVRDFVDCAFNCAGISKYELLDLSKAEVSEAEREIFFMRKRKENIWVVQHPQFFRPAEVNLLLGDASKARQVLNWQPKVSFDEMVARMVKHDLDLQRR